MQQVMADKLGLEQFRNWVLTATGTMLDRHVREYNKTWAWKQNILENDISEFITNEIFGCSACDFRLRWISKNADLFDGRSFDRIEDNKTSRVNKAILDQTARAVRLTSASAIRSTASSSGTSCVVIDEDQTEEDFQRLKEFYVDSKRRAVERHSKGGEKFPIDTGASHSILSNAVCRTPSRSPTHTPKRSASSSIDRRGSKHGRDAKKEER